MNWLWNGYKLANWYQRNYLRKRYITALVLPVAIEVSTHASRYL